MPLPAPEPSRMGFPVFRYLPDVYKRQRVRIAEALFRVLELVDFTLLLRIPDFQELLVIFPRHEKVERCV